MSKYVHIVHVHQMKNGKPNLAKVNHEAEFDTVRQAEAYIKYQNRIIKKMGDALAVIYYGRVNAKTGKLA